MLSTLTESFAFFLVLIIPFNSGNRLATREVGTNRPHPRSSPGALSLRKNELPIPTTTRIYGDHAACLTTLIDDGSLRFRIFNWVTGKLITESVRVRFLLCTPQT